MSNLFIETAIEKITKLIFQKIFGAVSEVIGPYIPLIISIAEIIGKIIEIYENVEYNKDVCTASMKSPSNCRKRQDNEDNERNFLDQEYYLTFYEFFHVMIRIKQFIIYVSKLQGVKKFFLTVSVKSQFNGIINDFETSMKDLNLTNFIDDNEESREIDHQYLIESVAEIIDVSSFIIFFSFIS